MKRGFLLQVALSSALVAACGTGTRPASPPESTLSDGEAPKGSGGSASNLEAGTDRTDAGVDGGAVHEDSFVASGGAVAAGGAGGAGAARGTGGAKQTDAALLDGGLKSILTKRVTFEVAPTCVRPTTVPVKILDDGVDTPQYDVLEAVGSRFYAYSRNSLALVTFDATGARVSSSVLGVVAAATDGLAVPALLALGEDISLEVYDPTLSPINGPTPIASGSPYAIALAARPGAMLASWTAEGNVHGKLLTTGAAVDFDLPTSAPASSCRTRVMPDSEGFALVSACAGATTSVYFAHVDVDGNAAPGNVVATADAPLELVDIEPSGTGFFGLFQQVSARKVFLLHWDAAGTLDAEPRGFGDVLQTYGLARSGDILALTLQALDETSTIMRLDINGAPTGDPPTCLDSALQGGAVALAGSTDGFIALVRYGNGSEWLLQLPNP